MSTEIKKAEGVPSVVSEEAMAKGIAKVTDELKARAIANVSAEHKPEAKTEVKTETKPEVKKADISILLTKVPDTFTPALLDKLFNLNDGGKTVRRHLRKNFAEPVGHAHKEKWTFTKAQADVLQYFADRYAFDLKVLEPVATAVKTA